MQKWVMKQEDSLFTQGLQCKQWVMKQGRLIVQQGVTMKQWVMKQGRLIVHTRSYNSTMGTEARTTHCSHKELQCNNG
ncbi:hypothetical protein KSS87_018498 [Heliosperma pusillum]|nr:hypothetical protein KSS87_018498 [Heliosperma pusillum]